MSNQTPDINDIFQIAQADGNLSQASYDALTVDADIAAQIQNGLGVSPEDVPASEVVLVSMMPMIPDRSASQEMPMPFARDITKCSTPSGHRNRTTKSWSIPGI